MPTTRKVAFALFAICVLATAGCGSKNKDKIVGKWKLVSAPGMDEKDIKMMEAFKMFVFFEFKADGNGTIGVTSADPEMLKMLEGKEKTSFPFKYKLGSGEAVELYDLPKEMQEKGSGGLFGKKDRAKVMIKIDGANMTLTDEEKKTGQFTKVN